MTDSMAALTALADVDCPERLPALETFYARWKDEPLVVDKWLAVQATSRLPGTLARVNELLGHPAFDIKVPNKVYALIRAFAANHVRFHAADGSGYAFLADQVLRLNTLNPQVAARMARAFDRWRKFDDSAQGGRARRARAHPRQQGPLQGRRRDRHQGARVSAFHDEPGRRDGGVPAYAFRNQHAAAGATGGCRWANGRTAASTRRSPSLRSRG